MLVLFETAAGFALFKVLNEGKLKNVDNIYKEFQNVESSGKVVQLQKFNRFKNTADALKATTALLDGKLSKNLKKFLQKQIVDKDIKDQLALSDAKLGGLIKEQLGIKCIHDNSIDELLRGIRNQISSLISDVSDSDMKAMSLGLSHSLSRYKLKFSPDKVDTMIIQAIALLDDLDKELNTYSMRVREWYGWHFPELSKIIPENVLFAKAVKKMGVRTNAASTNFSDFLPEELDKEIKEASQISMGTEVSEEDISNIIALCDQVISISEYREQLFEYLKNRMQAIAPNLTVMVGELVGARLISHAGSLLNLAKHPASTVQILGAEKALFRALKTKHETPKYGLIYHASLIGQAPQKLKGKISRVLAAKTSLAVRCDSFGEGEETPEIGIDARSKVENRLRVLEGGTAQKISGSAKKQQSTPKYDNKKNDKNQLRSTAAFSSAQDNVDSKENGNGKKEKKVKKEESEEEEEEKPKEKKKSKKVKKESEDEEEEKPKKKKKSEKNGKKSKKEESEDEEEEKPKDKKKKRKQVEEDEDEDDDSKEKEKKKKKKKKTSDD